MSVSTELPDRDPLPRYLAPLPKAIEDFGLRFAWLIVAINLVGTAFGFWYYSGQFARTAPVMWPWVPDSPLATLLIALALGAWKLGYELPWLTALAFFGNIILGLWTPYTLLVFAETYTAQTHPLMYQFLFWSHLGMVVQAFVLHRITDFPVRGVAVALAWYTSNVIVDYFVPIVGEPHHTAIPVPRDEPMFLGADALGLVAAGEVTFTLLALFLALATHSKKLQQKVDSPSGSVEAGTKQ